jgi:hypothetical protein
MFEIVQQHRASHALMHERLSPLFVTRTPMLGQTALFSSALQMACLYGDLNFAKMLVSRGENIDEVGHLLLHLDDRAACLCFSWCHAFLFVAWWQLASRASAFRASC